MLLALSIPIISLFFAISFVHFYWALGGQKWGNLAIPSKADNISVVFKPRPIETVIVALIFIGFAAIVAMRAGILYLAFLENYINTALWILASIFLLRSVGEFRYVGFFKKIKNTDFAQMDSKYYSPLCLFIGIILLIINSL